VVVLLTKFRLGIPRVRGGSENAGALDVGGNWCGHYWVEVRMPSGAEFVVDITADQFGYEPITVAPLTAARSRYRNGPQADVDDAFAALAEEFGCKDLVQVEAFLRTGT
jgi:hypothetical protein